MRVTSTFILFFVRSTITFVYGSPFLFGPTDGLFKAEGKLGLNVNNFLGSLTSNIGAGLKLFDGGLKMNSALKINSHDKKYLQNNDNLKDFIRNEADGGEYQDVALLQNVSAGNKYHGTLQNESGGSEHQGTFKKKLIGVKRDGTFQNKLVGNSQLSNNILLSQNIQETVHNQPSGQVNNRLKTHSSVGCIPCMNHQNK